MQLHVIQYMCSIDPPILISQVANIQAVLKFRVCLYLEVYSNADDLKYWTNQIISMSVLQETKEAAYFPGNS